MTQVGQETKATGSEKYGPEDVWKRQLKKGIKREWEGG